MIGGGIPRLASESLNGCRNPPGKAGQIRIVDWGLVKLCYICEGYSSGQLGGYWTRINCPKSLTINDKEGDQCPEPGRLFGNTCEQTYEASPHVTYGSEEYECECLFCNSDKKLEKKKINKLCADVASSDFKSSPSGKTTSSTGSVGEGTALKYPVDDTTGIGSTPGDPIICTEGNTRNFIDYRSFVDGKNRDACEYEICINGELGIWEKRSAVLSCSKLKSIL